MGIDSLGEIDYLNKKYDSEVFDLNKGLNKQNKIKKHPNKLMIPASEDVNFAQDQTLIEIELHTETNFSKK